MTKPSLAITKPLSTTYVLTYVLELLFGLRTHFLTYLLARLLTYLLAYLLTCLFTYLTTCLLTYVLIGGLLGLLVLVAAATAGLMDGLAGL